MTISKRLHKYLHDLYYNPKRKTSFSNLQILYNYIKEEAKFNVDKDTLKKWLLEQEVYTTHLNKHRPKHWNKIIIPHSKYMFEFDTAFLNSGVFCCSWST